MKKIIAMIIAITISMTAQCFAGEINLDLLSDTEIVNLVEDLKTEISERNIGRSGELGDGYYVVGKDIAAGTYEIQSKEYSAYYYIFPSEEDYSKYIELSKNLDIKTNSIEVDDDSASPLKLVDGNVLYVRFNVIIKESFNTLMP